MQLRILILNNSNNSSNNNNNLYSADSSAWGPVTGEAQTKYKMDQ